MNTREQKRAQQAFQKVESASHDNGLKKEYKTLAMDFPTMARSSGLIQTLSFFRAKNKTHHQRFLNHFREGLNELLPFDLGDDNDTFLENLRNMDINQYIALSRESIALGQWYKRHVQSLIEDE